MAEWKDECSIETYMKSLLLEIQRLKKKNWKLQKELKTLRVQQREDNLRWRLRA